MFRGRGGGGIGASRTKSTCATKCDAVAILFLEVFREERRTRSGRKHTKSTLFVVYTSF